MLKQIQSLFVSQDLVRSGLYPFFAWRPRASEGICVEALYYSIMLAPAFCIRHFSARVCKKALKEMKREDASFLCHLFSVTVSLKGREIRPARLLPKETNNFVKVNCGRWKSVGVELFLTFLHFASVFLFFFFFFLSIVAKYRTAAVHCRRCAPVPRAGGEIRSPCPLSETRHPCPHALSATMEDHTSLAPVPSQRARKETP